MSIQRFFQTLFTIKRMVWTDESSELSTVGSFYGHIQQTPADELPTLDSAYGKSHQVWCPVDTDVKTGDVIETGGISYSIRAINTRNYGTNQHLQLTIQEDKDGV